MNNSNVVISTTQSETMIVPFIQQALSQVRDEIADNPYVLEAITVLRVGGHRSAIGCFWNAVVDDLRNKVIHRSLELFNKAAGVGREVRTYEDFQNIVSDDQLIDGAYKIGVIGWEASKVLKHAKETRHIFDGHPKSSNPSIVKVLAMFDDCVKYVLSEPYPNQIIDIDEYITTMDSTNFDRNQIAVANALTELPEIYKDELIHRLFTVYVHPNTSSVLRSSVEFVAPILWPVLSKATKIQVVRRIDQQIAKSDITNTENAFGFVKIVGANAYLTASARHYILEPIVTKLKNGQDDWSVENDCVKALQGYAQNIPDNLLSDYVYALTHTFVGYMGGSAQFSRRDFYANGAAVLIPAMFEVFDDKAAMAFVETVKTSQAMRHRIEAPAKLARLRSLANIVLGRISSTFSEKLFLESLVDQTQYAAFLKILG